MTQQELDDKLIDCFYEVDENMEEIKRLVQLGANPHVKDNCLISLVIRKGEIEFLKYLIENHDMLDTWWGDVYLNLSIVENQIPIFYYLFDVTGEIDERIHPPNVYNKMQKLLLKRELYLS